MSEQLPRHGGLIDHTVVNSTAEMVPQSLGHPLFARVREEKLHELLKLSRAKMGWNVLLIWLALNVLLLLVIGAQDIQLLKTKHPARPLPPEQSSDFSVPEKTILSSPAEHIQRPMPKNWSATLLESDALRSLPVDRDVWELERDNLRLRIAVKQLVVEKASLENILRGLMKASAKR